MSRNRPANKNKFNKEQEHDKTRQMLDMMRGSNKKGSINEQEETAMSDEYIEKDPAHNDASELEPQMEPVKDDGEAKEDVIELSPEEMKEEKDKFRDNVDSRVEFHSFKVYPKSKNAVFAGTFEGMGGMHWQFTLEAKDGIYVSVDNLQLDEDSFETLQKLRGHYENWADEWSEKVVEEYAGSSDEEDEGEFPDF